MQRTIDNRAPGTNPMNLTCTSKVTGPDNTTTTYTIELQQAPAQPLQTPQGSTPLVPANSSVTYTFSGTLPNGNQIDVQFNGAGVLVYSTP